MGLWTAPEGAFTIEEFKRLPLEGRRWELLDGKVVQMEPHGLDISNLNLSLTLRIDEHVRRHNLGVTLGAGCGFRLWPGRETVRVTDMSFTRHDRIPAARDRDDYPRFAPDLIVEVFSPFERMATALGRVAMFLQAGTQVAWLVHPPAQTVTIFHPGAPLETLDVGKTLEGGDILPGVRIPIAEIFEEN